jgi:hypothetical protein
MNDQELRELLERDSADGPLKGVTIEDIQARARSIRRRRSRMAALLAAAALVVVGAAGLPRIMAASAPDDIWTGTLAVPTALPPTGRPSAEVPPTASEGDTGRRPTMFEYHHYGQGGEAVSLTFESGTKESLMKSVAFAVECPADNHVFIWLNDKLVVSRRCSPDLRKPPGWVGESPVLPAGGSINRVVAALVPTSSLGAGAAETEAAQQALSRTTPYPAQWWLGLVEPPGRR